MPPTSTHSPAPLPTPFFLDLLSTHPLPPCQKLILPSSPVPHSLHHPSLNQIDFLDDSHSIPPLPQPHFILNPNPQLVHDILGSSLLSHHPDCDHDSSEKPNPTKAHVLSWDTFDRPISSSHSVHPQLAYQTPYPVEEDVSVWEAVMASAGISSSFTIDQQQFSAHFFRRAIGLTSNLTPKPSSTEFGCPRIIGQSALASQSIAAISETAFTNLTTLERFIKLTRRDEHCLRSGLAILLDWIRIEIADCFDSEPALGYGLVSLSMLLEPVFGLLEALAALIDTCGLDSSTRVSQEDAVYEHLDRHIRAGASSLVQAVFSWLLDRVCVRMLLGWETWLGIDPGPRALWGREKDELHLGLWKYCGIERAPHAGLNEARDATLLAHPPGVGQGDLAYLFRPDRLPQFFPVTLAESLFEAGRALRVLRQSTEANSQHPICLSFPAEAYGRSRWVWTNEELERVPEALERQAQDMKIQTSAWRHGINLAHSTCATMESRDPRPLRQDLGESDEKAGLSDFLERVTSTLRSPAGQRPRMACHSQRRAGLVATLEARLKCCDPGGPGLLSAMEVPSLGVLANLTVFGPLEARSRDINASLLSFFVIDMALLDHLDILARFMFCTDVRFNQRLSRALFDQSEAELYSRRPVGVSARLMRRGTWPPGGFDLSFALRSVILDSVAFDERPSSARGSSAWAEVEDRLSFAVGATAEEEAGYGPETVDGFRFLVLDFKPPSALGTVLGPEILEQYRLVNQHLMKLLRLQSVMRANWRTIRPARRLGSRPGEQERRYMHERDMLAASSQRLLDGLVSFTWEVAIGANWGAFVGAVSELREAIMRRESWSAEGMVVGGEGLGVGLGGIGSVEELVRLHRQTLAEITTSLFLRERQQSFARTLSQAIFETIIELAVHLTAEHDDWEIKRAQVAGIGARQRAGVAKLVRALDHLSDRAADRQRDQQGWPGGMNGRSEVGFLKELVVRLDWNMFYVEQ